MTRPICRQLFLAAATTLLLLTTAAAAPVTGWLKDTSFGKGETASLTNASTASPILGNNSANNADNVAIYAGFAPRILANGQRLTLSASAQLIGTSSNPDFRWGLFKDDGGGAPTGGWLGFMGSAESTIWSKDPNGAGFPNATFASTAQGRGAVLGQATEANGILFGPGTYALTMSVERFNNEIDVQVSITNASTGYTIVSQAFTEPEPSRLTFAFDRVGFLAGSILDADQIRFANVDVSVANIERPKLQVHSSGLVVLANQTTVPAELVQYEITSNGGSLDRDGWSSLDSHEKNDPFGSGWDEVAASGSHVLAELNILGSKVLGAAEQLSLGHAFEPGSAKDLAFRFTTADGNLHRGVVEYVQSGDYSRDGTVDAADYVLWRKTLGSALPLGTAADGDGNGQVDFTDYSVFAGAFGEAAVVEAVAASAVNVPEPASRLSSLLAVAYLVQHSWGRERRLRK